MESWMKNRALWLLPLTALACKQDYEVTRQAAIVSTSFATFDAGMVAVNDSKTVRIFLASTGQADAEIYDITVEDSEHWTIHPDWKDADFDGNGSKDGMMIPGGSPTDPLYGMIEVAFKPDAEEEYRTVLTIASNDSEITEKDEKGRSLWKVVLRGIGRYPCGRVWPTFHDFGPRPAGGYFDTSVNIENCGVVPLTVTGFDISGNRESFSVDTQARVIFPGETEPFDMVFVPAGDESATSASIYPLSNDPDLHETEILVIGNDCASSALSEWDGDSDGWFECGGDCDDSDAAISPSAQEDRENGVDDDCDTQTDELSNGRDSDLDADGYSENDGDCDDDDIAINPGATEALNQIDDNCDGDIDEGSERFDDDQDGFSEQEGDCNDADNLVYPGANEGTEDIDDDCDGIIDEGSYTYDDDEDGFNELGEGGEPDCDDDNPWAYVGASEDCDFHDNDCDGLVDEGEDDSPDGACAFISDRQVVVAEEKKGCQVAPGAGLAPVALGLLALLRRRRR
jgi:MYXO-CTERM domain-containing protein